MKDFILEQARHFAKLTHANTRDYEKLNNLEKRFYLELNPFIRLPDRLVYINEYEKETRFLFKTHLERCPKPETCPQNKTHSNAIFLVSQERAIIHDNLGSIKESTFKKGEFFDAYKAIMDIIEIATKSIKLIDNYVDQHTLELLKQKKGSDIQIKILTKTSSKTDKLVVFVDMFNKQYGRLEVKASDIFHDRFLIIDDSLTYMIGASIKDLGKKFFMINKVEGDNLKKIIFEQFNQEWHKA